jgi:hypothetical protein
MNYYDTYDQIDDKLSELFMDYVKKKEELMADFYANVSMLMTIYRDVIDTDIEQRKGEPQ